MSSLTTRSRLSRFFSRLAFTAVLGTGLAYAASPNAFTFIVRTNVATAALVTSESKTITGVPAGGLAVSVSGAGSPQYKIGSGTFTSNPGTITDGQTLTVRHTSSTHASTETLSTVTVGDYSTPFKSVTGATDRTPEPFGFDTQNNVEPGVVVVSNTLTLTDYNTAVSVTAGSGAQYSIDGGAFTATAGTINPGQTLTLRHTSSSQPLGIVKTSVTVGGVTGFFQTRTRSNNTAPTISSIADQATDEDTATAPIGFTVGDAETAPGSLTVSATSANQAVVADADIALGGSGASRTITLSPAANASGSALITVSVSDGISSTSTSFTLTVNPVNDGPQAFDDGAITDEDTVVVIDVLANDVGGDAALDPASVAIQNESHGVATVNGQGQVSFLPDANYFGTDAGFSYTVNDTNGATSNVATVSITVNPVNDAPLAEGAEFSTDEDVALDGFVTASDADGDELSFAKASDPAHGTVAIEADGSFIYTPAQNFAGSDSFTFVANDGTSDSAPATIAITVNDKADAVLSVSDVSVGEDAGTMTFTVSLSREPDGPVTIHYTTADGSAKAGSDYSAASGDLLFGAEALSQTVVVPVSDDATHEGTESLTLALSATDNAGAIEPGSDFEATGTIVDNDAENTTLLRVGAAKRSIQPAQRHIDGMLEARVVDPAVVSPGAPQPITHKQKFNLGGFGINPLSNVPDDPFGGMETANESLTEPASYRMFRNSGGHDEETQVRAMAVRTPGGDTTVVFVMIDAVGAGNIIQKNVKQSIIDAAAALTPPVTLLPENILFGQTHSHSGADLQGLWGGVPQDWVENTLYPAAAAAAAEALATAQPARISFRQGMTDKDGQFKYNNYRRPPIDPERDTDRTITLLHAETESGEPIANILQFDAHPTGVNTSPRTAHPDFILGAMEWLENPQHEGGVSLYYNGPIADASGSGSRPGCQPIGADQPYSGVRCKGEGIADYLLDPAHVKAQRELEPTLTARSVEVYLPVTNPGFLAFGLTGSFNRYYNFMDTATDMIPGIDPYLANLPQLTPVARTYVSRITLGGAEGGLEIVTIPGEATGSFGRYIRGLAKTNMMLMGLTHNSFGYIIPEDEFSYVDQTGDAGLVVPFTGYEEMVSLGPLTAPLLRAEAYNRLFDVDATQGDLRDVPPSIKSCADDPASHDCVLTMVENRIDVFIEQFGNILLGPIAGACHSLPEQFAPVCAVLDGVVADGAPTTADALLAVEVAKTEAMGCDFLDPANCMFPFPNDFFTVDATPGSPQAADLGGTGRRVNFNMLGMPRNSAGKPVDPTEWNRNDGFSPGQMIVTYVPGLKANADGTIPGAVPITDVQRSYDANAPIFVIDADTGERQLIWAEIDLNANLLLHGSVPQTEESFGDQDRPLNDGRSALIIRPAKNFEEGHRYIVALRALKGADGATLKPGVGFQACRGDVPSLLREQSPMKERCDHIAGVIDQLAAAETARGAAFDAKDLYLTWDFTVASAKNDVSRLAHMRDAAFNSLATVPGTDCTQLTEANAAACAAPKFTVDKVTEHPQGGIARRIEGTITVPSFVTPVEPTPADNAAARQATSAICNGVPQEDFNGGCADVAQIGSGATLPPNRLFYNPADATPTDPTQARYGDGLPDSVGTMETPFMCQIPDKALAEPARASIYGHGLLDARVAVTYEGSPEFERDHNFMYCAVDLFGFATGDLGNVASTLVDVSNFPVIPDGSQQGLLNYMFLARAIGHPNGFLGNAAFQNNGAPLFDRREVFYNGNSQGGIVGGVVMAISKDINRGVLGSLGMNYSTLLQRSKDFDPYSTVIYSSYTEPLDRMFLFSMMQMLWDRSENNGYAEHLTRKTEIEGGPVDHVMLNSMFADQQVTSWSADVMARTMGIPVDYAMIDRSGHHHPDLVPGWPQPRVSYDTVEGDAQYADVSSVLFDYNSREISQNVPIGNVPMREGPDPHDSSHRRRQGRCQISHWLQRDGRLLNLNTDAFTPEAGDHAVDCPAVHDNSGAPGPGEVITPPSHDLAGALGDAVDRFVAAISTIPDHLSDGDVVGALDALLAGTQQLAGDAYVAIAQQGGDAAGLSLPPPAQDAAPELPAPQALMAGAAKRPIHVPVGTPLGGYLRPPVGGEYIGDDPAGELTDNVPAMADGCDPTQPESCPPLVPIPDELRKVHSPYATYSPPSRGYYDSLTVKAVALYDGHDYVVMVKTDMIGMLNEVVEDVKAQVKAERGIDLGDGLIMSGTHTHDGPGALANDSTRYFWLAMDAYQHDVYRKVIKDLAQVVLDALDDLHPAKIGHATGFDHKHLHHYRRDREPWYSDNDAPGCNWVANDDCEGENDADELRDRIGVLRVDDAATGEPMAIVINYAIHGIAFDVENQYFSGDVIGSIERETEQSYTRSAGERAPIAMMIQNTAGDVTPDSGNIFQYGIRGIEYAGKRMAPQVRAIADGIADFDGAPDLRSVSQRIVLDRKHLGYTDDEYPYPWGAAQCGNDLAVPFADVGVGNIPGYDQTGLPRKHPYCIFSPAPDANDLADNGVAENGAFLPQDTILTAAKIGGITLMVQPGEPLTEYGVRLMEMAENEGYNPHDTFVWGYSGDHAGYIVPPVEHDWATFGGAESTTTFWGWKQGERFIDVSRDLVKALRDGTAAPADEFQADYSKYRAIYDATPAAVPTPSLLPGALVAQPDDIKHFEKTAFIWEGGDPVLDFPQVVMQHADGTPVRRANGEIVDTFFEMHLKYRLETGRHLWTIEFEAPKDWQPGSYQFAVSGKAMQGSEIAYELVSRPFAVAGSQSLTISNPVTAGDSCQVELKYTTHPTNYRVVDGETHPSQNAPVRDGSVTFTSDGVDTVVEHVKGTTAVYAMAGACPAGVAAHGSDAWANTSPTVGGGGGPTDSDGDGVPDSSDTCPNTPAGTPVDANGCPENNETPPFPLPLCEPFQGYCVHDIPGIGETIEDAILSAWATLNGGGGEPPPVEPPTDVLPDQCDPITHENCLSDLPDPVGGLFGEGGGTEPPGTGAGDVDQLAAELQSLPADLQASVEQTADNAANGKLADRSAEAVIMEGKSFPDWSQPAAQGVSMPYPNGAVIGERDAHAGIMLYPPVDFAGLPTAAPVNEIAAYRLENGAWVEIPVQVDERFPYFLANPNSDFGVYSGTDTELTYAWDRETWKADGQCRIDESSVAPMADPVPGLDDDDEIAFMAKDAGSEQADPTLAGPEGTSGGSQEIALADPLAPGAPKFVYLFRKAGGSSFAAGHYVQYTRDANADQWVDRGFWADNDPQKIGTSNTGYGPNLSGTVCPDGVTPRQSNDRFPRDGVTISSDRYQVYASGRWMVRNVRIAKPGAGNEGNYGVDIMDRWKGRAFQQAPDSTISAVGFEDEQVNWEANSALLGERAGPIRAIREIWGADSGTNVTKTETYYRDAYVYRYHVRVHPIPPDGLYTSWDYNRGAMVPAPGENVPGGRYYTAVRGNGVPIDGINDDIGNVDSVDPIPGVGCFSVDDKGFIPPDANGKCPAFFDASDPALNLPLTMYNWEQVSAKGDLGSLVYLMELKGATIGANSAAIPYYRDDACLDDGTGDDPVQRPWPGESYRWNNGMVPKAYDQRAGRALDHSGNTFADCVERQGAHAQHGVHFLMPPESDNATMPVPVDEIDGQQWAFAVPTAAPTNVGERYANIVRVPLVRVAHPRPATGGSPGGQSLPDYETCVAMAQEGGAADHEAAAKFACAVIFGGGRGEGEDGKGQIQGPNTYVPMADGTLIATNVYIPWGCNVAKNPDAKPCASILEMSGYESGSDEGQTPAGDIDDILRQETGQGGMPLTSGTRGAHGKYYTSGERYVSVVANVRGTGCSAGEFDVFSRKSAEDGKYLIDQWMAQQAWSNGKVGIFGHSYSGITGAMIASTAPEHLKVVSVSGQIGDIYRDIVYPGGVSNYGFPLLWTAGVRMAYDYLGGGVAGVLADSGPTDRQCAKNMATRTRTTEDPLIVGLTDTDTPWMQERSVVNYLYKVNAPTQIATAYQDEQTGPRGGTHVFDKLPQNLTRRLVTLNGDHGTQTGPAEVTAERKYWIDRFMLDANDPNPGRRPRAWNPQTSLPEPVFADDGTATSRVLLEVDADRRLSNGHIDSNGFPLSQTQWTDFYLQADGSLDTAKSTVLEGEAGASSSYFSGSKRQLYSYQAGKNEGGAVSSADANGADELVFALNVNDVAESYTDTSGNAQKAFVIAGPITARLFLSTSGGDTELMVQLIDADPATGERLYLQRGVLKASHRAIESQHSQCAQFPSGGRITSRECTLADNLYRPHRPHVSPETILPGVINEYLLEVFPVGHVLREGHQLLVKISAPALDDNDWAYIQKTPPGINTLHYSAKYPSSIRLPVIPVADVQRLGSDRGQCNDNEMRCVISGAVSDPTGDYRSQCWAYGEQFDPTYPTFTGMVCGAFDTIAETLFGAAGGDGGSSPGNDVGAVTGQVFNAAGSGIEGVLGTDGLPQGHVLAGVGVVDMTPDVGYGAGQYSDSDPTRYGADPYATGKKQAKSYGVLSRLTGRAIVIEGGNGKRIALLKSDNYLAQDNLVRRISQILAENNSSIGYDQILYGVTHAHSSSYYSTPSWGVWAFQDAFDPRQFEYQARRLAEAILIAERDLQPARMGATTVRHKVFKGQIMGPTGADDGTPVQYPNEYGDHGLVVMRIENTETGAPIAAWINWGEHPEGLDGYDLHSADYVAFLERFVDRDLGAPVVFSQADVGSSEKSGNTSQRIRDDGTVCNDEPGETCEPGQGVWRDWNHNGYVQNERNARFLADAVVKGWKVIGGEQPVDAPVAGPVLPNNYVPEVQVAMSDTFPVDYRNAFVPGPLSHPYPSVSNCRSEPTAEGNPGAPVVGLPDCQRVQDSNDRAQVIWETMKAEGLPVPEHYDASAFTGVEENLRLKLQAVRLGDMVLGSCACEAQVDLILNFESRANDVAGDIYDGFDWACVAEDSNQRGFSSADRDPAFAEACRLQREKYYDAREFPIGVPGDNFSPAAIARMRAQVHNPADGWDAPEYVPYANSEPVDPKAIKGNFTKEELPAAHGYKLAVGVGHAGDYNGYTVSYREYMSHDHYRKALTAYGSHTADYMVTRLVRMAGAMKGAPELAAEPLDTTAQADEARMVAESTALGQSTKNAYESYYAALPPDASAETAPTQPADIGYFEAATFTWTGGATAVDNPHVIVERCDGGSDRACSDGTWQRFADQTGEVQTRVQWPSADQVPTVYAGQFEWRWSANFEAYEAFPARMGTTPTGFYRFAVQGCINDGSEPDANLTNRIANFFAGMLPGAVSAELVDVLPPSGCKGGAAPYSLASNGFEVTAPYDLVDGVQAHADGLTLLVDAYSIPRSYSSPLFPYISTANDYGRFCRECSFRPWAISAASPTQVTVVVDGQSYEATGVANRNWFVPGLTMSANQVATIVPSYSDGRSGRPHAFTFNGTFAPADGDHDSIADSADNCPTTPNTDQADNDKDGQGNACDATPNEANGGSGGAPQLCAPDQVPEIGGECAGNNGGEAIQEAVDTVYDTVTGITGEPSVPAAPLAQPRL